MSRNGDSPEKLNRTTKLPKIGGANPRSPLSNPSTHSLDGVGGAVTRVDQKMKKDHSGNPFMFGRRFVANIGLFAQLSLA
jgi:hypothetical protein